MTTPEEIETQQPDPAAQEVLHYVIDRSRSRELNRSLAMILLSRRCPSCKARLEANGETPSEEDQIREIAKCCANQEGFIRPDMPMQEIVFRALLSEGNHPTSLEQLHYLVTERWYTPANPKSISTEGLKRVLDNDMYYGVQGVLRAFRD